MCNLATVCTQWVRKCCQVYLVVEFDIARKGTTSRWQLKMANGNELISVVLYVHGHGQNASDMISEEMAIVVKASSSQGRKGWISSADMDWIVSLGKLLLNWLSGSEVEVGLGCVLAFALVQPVVF